MKKKIFLATNNEGKIERYKKLLAYAGLEFEVNTPKEFGLDRIVAKETGTTLAENAEIKARAYLGKVDMPVLANDTGFFVEEEGLITTPKRSALTTKEERALSKEEIAKKMSDFWRGIARKHGGRVNAAWIEAFVLIDESGISHTAEARRNIILTDETYGEPHLELPVRAHYISKATNRPAVQHTEKEEMLEMQPVLEALKNCLVKIR